MCTCLFRQCVRLTLGLSGRADGSDAVEGSSREGQPVEPHTCLNNWKQFDYSTLPVERRGSLTLGEAGAFERPKRAQLVCIYT